MTHTEGEKRRSDERVPPTGFRFDHKEWETSRYARIQGWSLQRMTLRVQTHCVTLFQTRAFQYIYTKSQLMNNTFVLGFNMHQQTQQRRSGKKHTNENVLRAHTKYKASFLHTPHKAQREYCGVECRILT